MPGRGASPSSTAARPACRHACAGRCSTRCRSTSTARRSSRGASARSSRALASRASTCGPWRWWQTVSTCSPCRPISNSRAPASTFPHSTRRRRRRRGSRRTYAATRTRRPTSLPWEAFLAALPPPAGATATTSGPSAELLYVFDPVRSTTTPGMFVEVLRRQRRKNGDWATPRDVFIPRSEVKALPDADDREILERVCGAADAWTGAWNIAGAVPVPSPFVLTPALQRDLIERMCATGRLMLRPIGSDGSPTPLVPIHWTPATATFRLVDRRIGRRRVHGDRRASITRGRNAHFTTRCSSREPWCCGAPPTTRRRPSRRSMPRARTDGSPR